MVLLLTFLLESCTMRYQEEKTMTNSQTKYAVIFTEEQMNYLLNVLEPIADQDPVLDSTTEQFNMSILLDENEEYVRT
jgi:hypothetical protein